MDESSDSPINPMRGRDKDSFLNALRAPSNASAKIKAKTIKFISARSGNSNLKKNKGEMILITTVATVETSAKAKVCETWFRRNVEVVSYFKIKKHAMIMMIPPVVVAPAILIIHSIKATMLGSKLKRLDLLFGWFIVIHSFLLYNYAINTF